MAISLSNHEDRIKALENNTYVRSLKVIAIETPTSDMAFEVPESDWDYAIISAVTTRYNERCPALMISRHHDEHYIYGLDFNNYMVWDYISATNILKLSVSTPFKLSRLIAFVLKLYYNFSYNIYRVANSISFHFFKCLINSFKGGVKEIWQLV